MYYFMNFILLIMNIYLRMFMNESNFAYATKVTLAVGTEATIPNTYILSLFSSSGILKANRRILYI